MREAFQYFDKTFLINLDRRPDRLSRCQEMFKSFGIADLIERFPAIVPDEFDKIPSTHDTEKIKVPLYGCLLSHISIIKMAKSNKWKSVMVLEDDVEFINTDSINLSVSQLKKRDWGLFYLGTNLHCQLERADNNLLKLKKGFATHAIAYHERFYDYYLDNFNKELIPIIDVWLAENGQERFPCFCTYPITAVQVSNHSDIHNAFADYSWMETKFKEHTINIK